MSLARILTLAINVLYFAPHSRFLSLQMWRYLVCGVGNYIVLDGLLYAFLYNVIVAHHFLDLRFVTVSPHILSLLIVFPITLATGFWLNRHVAFQGAEAMAADRQFFRYVISIFGSIVLSYVAMKFLVEYMHIWPTPSKVVSSLLTAAYSYLMAKFYTFIPSKGEKSVEK